MVEGEGFEPSKHEAADLQSAGFDRSPTPPEYQAIMLGAILLLQAYYVNLNWGYIIIYISNDALKLNKKIISEKFEKSFSFKVPEIHISQITESTNEDAKQELSRPSKKRLLYSSFRTTNCWKRAKWKALGESKRENIYLSIAWNSSKSFCTSRLKLGNWYRRRK